MKPEANIEAVLYAAGEEGVSLSHLSDLLNLSLNEVNKSISHLDNKYNQDPLSGLVLLSTADRYILAAKKEAEPIIRRFAQSPLRTPLSRAALEILAIVAYKQPVTRVEIDLIRGVQSGGSLQKLILRGLVKEKGRLEGPGRPTLYGTTDYFLNYFGLNNLESLPELPKAEEDAMVGLDLFSNSEPYQKDEE